MRFLEPLNPPIRDWRGLRVWLVGGSAGIGAALASDLAARGARLALSARDADRLAAVAADCSGSLALTMDVTRGAPEYARVRDDLLAAWGGIDLVVLNAGTYRPMRAWELEPEAVRATLDVNLLGVIDGVSSVLPTLLAQECGAIAIVGSVAAYRGLPQAAAYGASKAALVNFAESLYLDLAPRGVAIHLISPGFVATRLTAQNPFTMPALMQPEDAATEIVAGFARGDFETHFPRRFTRLMKLLRVLPYRLYFPLVRRVTGS
ncbi:SDR family NAD(P)-dependent oxidoreductase [Aromatoleum toluolicum]|uniref:SDR family NAD(P)-dependent oxidoreductase n=1 Tax=Aromatoleum toluolicum TaxID=90060 RepID=A0ABX1NC36_9RHOO|nr:SDR family NAD(P)-dependent oxidoreductase [Aromatoleum toluolicum]NMF96775.1 SDR family NAD(P)-dependent oxidoreductase [Aromatoleum toluolicum]